MKLMNGQILSLPGWVTDRRINMAKKKARIELIDIAKAITIFLVIVGHTTGNLETPLYRRVLYSFHMPLFFFLSGLSIKPSLIKGWRDWYAFIRKNILALAVPFFIWGLVYAPFSFQGMTFLLYGSWQALGKMGTLTSLWYLSCFFLARILVQIMTTVLISFGESKIPLKCGICAVPMFAIGFLLPSLEGGYPWCLDVAFVASGFILLGIAFRYQILVLAQAKTWVLITSFLGSLLVFMIGTVLRGDSLDLSLMCAAGYGNVFWFMLNSASGTMVVMLLSMLLIRVAREGWHTFSVNIISFIGQNTLGIFLLHKNLLQGLILPWVQSFITGNAAAVIIASILALIASMALCIPIKYYIPQLLGQFPRYEDQAPSILENIRQR